MRNTISITNHARLRYLERIKHFSKEKLKVCQGRNEYEKLRTLQRFDIVDIKSLDLEILGSNPQKALEQIHKLKTCIYPVGTHSLKVINNTIVTILGGDHGSKEEAEVEKVQAE